MSIRDQELIAACLAGDTSAFAELIRPYQDRLYNVLYRFVGKRDEAAELLQEAMIRAFRGLRSYQGDASFYTWLYRIALNVACTARRKQRSAWVSVESLTPRGPLDIADEDLANRPSSQLEQEERRALVQKALADVPEPYRAVLILKDIEGLKYEEIAEILDIPVGTVRSRLHRARAEMRDRLKPMLEKGTL